MNFKTKPRPRYWKVTVYRARPKFLNDFLKDFTLNMYLIIHNYFDFYLTVKCVNRWKFSTVNYFITLYICNEDKRWPKKTNALKTNTPRILYVVNYDASCFMIANMYNSHTYVHTYIPYIHTYTYIHITSHEKMIRWNPGAKSFFVIRFLISVRRRLRKHLDNFSERNRHSIMARI